ncbi:type II CAAX prenyl endopeptidase Rce1 family protein [Promineifilum sp.]|uniref:CPBP family glutamic-type intramembrane protease n=1 Tax=Promineifilum sp. TaxID=2664178 RepID=UPI0035B37E75
MSSGALISSSRARLPLSIALAVTLLMAATYTALDVFQPVEPALSLLAFIPGGVSLLALAAAGLSRADLKLRFAPLSGRGAMALAAATLLLLPILGSNNGWAGWQWLPALVYAPASGIAQELYFRCALLSGLERALAGRARAALLLHAVLFIGFHLRTFRSITAPAIMLLVALVLFLGGLAWGWQVQRDRTAIWAMIQHSLFLMLMSLFAWG